MKRIILVLIATISLGGLAKAQVADHAIGLRFGSGDGLGTEISYQHGLGSFNRLELDLGFSSNAVLPPDQGPRHQTDGEGHKGNDDIGHCYSVMRVAW